MVSSGSGSISFHRMILPIFSHLECKEVFMGCFNTEAQGCKDFWKIIQTQSCWYSLESSLSTHSDEYLYAIEALRNYNLEVSEFCYNTFFELCIPVY